MSYASDLRSAAEAERDAWERVQSITFITFALLVRHTESYCRRIALTTPDRLLPFLAYVEQLERVAEAASEIPETWEQMSNPANPTSAAAFCKMDRLVRDLATLDALDREAR